MGDYVNADFTERAVAETEGMEWEASPGAGVLRKRLDLVGGEFGRVTSVVRYEKGARFHGHTHPGGEEILVLAGIFSDEHGDYPVGTYLLNPPGFVHEPFSREGCVLFVKLCQYEGREREQVTLDTNRMTWESWPRLGVSTKVLYRDRSYPEQMRLEKWEPGTRIKRHTHPGGEETFVLEGGFADGNGRYPKGTWLRMPPGSEHAPWTEEGTIVYLKTGGLTDAAALTEKARAGIGAG